MTDHITAPWTSEQVDALNRFQQAGRMHPFTCGRDHDGHRVLDATHAGWICPDPNCDYTQGWAHAFMAQPERDVAASIDATYAARQAPEPHTCKPGASTYFCPTAGEVESDCHGGFDVCCGRPDLHIPAAEADPTIAALQAAARRKGMRLALSIDDAADHAHRDQVNAPLGERTIAAINARIAASDLPRRKVKARPPTLRDQALTAARQTIRDGQWWLPPAGQEQLVDAILTVIQQRTDRIRADADHHDGCLRESNADGGISHSSIAAGLRIALRHLDADIPQPRTEPEPEPQKELVVRKIAILRQLCPTGQHVEHPGYTCNEANWWATRWAEVIDNASRAFDALTAQDAEVPAALRGPNWKGKP